MDSNPDGTQMKNKVNLYFSKLLPNISVIGDSGRKINYVQALLCSNTFKDT